VTIEPAGAQSASATAATSTAAASDPAGAVANVAGAAQEAASASVASAPVENVVDLVVPDIGNFTDIPIIEVLVAPGETIAKDAPLVTLESDKATMEVPAASGGVIREVKVKVGDTVSQGTVIATVSTGAPAAAPASAPQTPAAPPPAPAPTPAPAAASAPAPTTPPVTNGRHPVPPMAPAATVSPSAPSTNGTAVTSGPVHASPAIRRFARELGVDLAHVTGSGPNGRVTRDDVQGYVKRNLAAPGPAVAAPGPVQSGLGLGLPPWPTVDFAKYGPVERVALSRIQKISGPALHRNWVMIPHVTQNEDADVTDLESFRKQINGELKDVKVTMLAFLIKASIAALKRYPTFNASLDGDALVLKRYYNIGFAADTAQGLVVPVIRNADTKGLVEIARESAELAAKAREGKLSADDMSGATFTISSLGSIGGTTFTPIINAPEVAILGAARADIKPVWDGSAFVPRLIQPLSLAYDHRVIDGASAARFVVALKQTLGDLRRTLL
ncbi:MAG TPA: dihydrolipoyllysine-residue acetyltransferase, partial [Candidatus Acidoferrum sp.]|nr:dihydrolipoyllysine-residue acetyltransferase [Candidatus Acidoferrum sp.]